MNAMIVKREKVFYNDTSVVDDFASASAIRRLISLRQYDDIRRVMPRTNYRILMDELQRGNIVLDLAQYEKEIIYKLRTMSIDEIKNLPDVSEGLENAIKNAAGLCNNLPELINMIKTKRYTRNKSTTNFNLLLAWNYKKRYGIIKKSKAIC